MRALRRVLTRADRGASAVEYALLLGVVALGLVLAVVAIEELLGAVFTETCDAPGFDCS